MRCACLLLTCLAALLFAAPVAAQQSDYLTPEEVEKVRDTQEPNQRAQLFLLFAHQRLEVLEKAMGAPELPRLFVLKDMLNDFIRAVDDTAEVLEWNLEMGGVELRKGREEVNKKGKEFLERLEQLQQSHEIAQSEDLRYDFEDATIALEDLLEIAKRVPDGLIPAKEFPEAAAGEEAEPEAGKPTLRRRDDKPKPPKKD
ncbi:MAG: hypothetical protein HYY26_02490 [Acidobacteria bacterium]|nr:hypothetical protein [Acidobacteriota bacterium]